MRRVLGVEGSRADSVDLTGDEGDGGGAWKVLRSGQGRVGESAQVAGVRWVFKGAAVHRIKDASAGGGVSGSKYSLEPKGKVAQAAEENVTGRIRPKTESWRNKEWSSKNYNQGSLRIVIWE